jgi:hypothetical protein
MLEVTDTALSGEEASTVLLFMQCYKVDPLLRMPGCFGGSSARAG